MASQFALRRDPFTVCFVDQDAVLKHVVVSPPIDFADLLVVLHDLTKPYAHNLPGLPVTKDKDEGLSLTDGDWWYRVLRPPTKVNIRYVQNIGWYQSSADPIKGDWQILNCRADFDSLIIQLILGPTAQGSWIEVQHDWQKHRDEGFPGGILSKRKGPLIVDPDMIKQDDQSLPFVDAEPPTRGMTSAYLLRNSSMNTLSTSAEVHNNQEVIDSTGEPAKHAGLTSHQYWALSKGPSMGRFYATKKHENQPYSSQQGQDLTFASLKAFNEQMNDPVAQQTHTSRGPKMGLFYPPKYQQTQNYVQTMTEGLDTNPRSQQAHEDLRTAANRDYPFMFPPKQHDTRRQMSYETNPYADDPPINSNASDLYGPGPSIAATDSSEAADVAPLQFRPSSTEFVQRSADLQLPSSYPGRRMSAFGPDINQMSFPTSLGQANLDPALELNNPDESGYVSRKFGNRNHGHRYAKLKKSKKADGAHARSSHAPALANDQARGMLGGSGYNNLFQSPFMPQIMPIQYPQQFGIPTREAPSISAAVARSSVPGLPPVQVKHEGVQSNRAHKGSKKAPKNKAKKKYYDEAITEMRDEAKARQAQQKDARDERAARRESLRD